MAEGGCIYEKFEEATLQCVICLETYTDPRTLACLHTFCQKCLQNHIQESSKDGKFNCPTCRHETKIPEDGPEGLPKNFFISNLMETFTKMFKESVVKCELCDEQQKAEYRCFTCQKYVCLPCNDAHNRLTSVFKNHQTKPISECTNLKMADLCQMNPELCNIHLQEVLKFYCYDCHQSICRDCRLGEHFNHDCKDLAILSDEAKISVKTAVEQLHQHISWHKLKAETLKHWKQTSVSTKEDILEAMHKEKQEIIRRINDHFKNCERTVEMKTSAIMKDIELQMEGLEENIAQLESLCDMGERILVYGRSAETVGIKYQLESAVKTENENHNPLQQLSYMKWEKGDSNSVKLEELLGKSVEILADDDSRPEALVRFHVHNISNLWKSNYSPSFTVLDLTWKIEVAPLLELYQRKGLSIYFSQSNVNKQCNAITEMLLINYGTGKALCKKSKHTSFEPESSWGYKHFVDWDELKGGYIKDDSITIEIRPSADGLILYNPWHKFRKL